MQRAYRERKERHSRELEGQIADWQHKHQLLKSSYSKQSEEVGRLKSQIEQLNGKITALQNGLPSLYGSLNQSSTEFDLSAGLQSWRLVTFLTTVASFVQHVEMVTGTSEDDLLLESNDVYLGAMPAA